LAAALETGVADFKTGAFFGGATLGCTLGAAALGEAFCAGFVRETAGVLDFFAGMGTSKKTSEMEPADHTNIARQPHSGGQSR
jgi:hypothetical protein